jgi:hypothetical protein
MKNIYYKKWKRKWFGKKLIYARVYYNMSIVYVTNQKTQKESIRIDIVRRQQWVVTHLTNEISLVMKKYAHNHNDTWKIIHIY